MDDDRERYVQQQYIIPEEQHKYLPLEDRALLTEVARALVDHPEEVQVVESQRNGNHVLTLTVHPKDRGKVIGRRGRTISALRNIFTSIGAADGRRLIVEVQG